MPKTRLISPGISNHSLKKNLELDGNYISNDGGDEGIFITDTGIVAIKSTGVDDDTVLRLHDSQDAGLNQFTDIQYNNGDDSLRFYVNDTSAFRTLFTGLTNAMAVRGNYNQVGGNGTHAVCFAPQISEGWSNTAGKPRMLFSSDNDTSFDGDSIAVAQTFAVGSGTSRFMELQEAWNPQSGSVDYNFHE